MHLIGLTLASLIIFVIFNMIGIRKFGMKSCFSEYGELWGKAVPIKNMNLWSIVLGVCAALLIPPILQATEGNPWQFLGFLSPAYLFLVVFTPNYKETKKKWAIHAIGAILCMIGMAVWMLCIMHMWIPLVVCASAFTVIGLCAKNLWYAIIYYVELALFMSVYWVLLAY